MSTCLWFVKSTYVECLNVICNYGLIRTALCHGSLPFSRHASCSGDHVKGHCIGSLHKEATGKVNVC